MAYSPMAGENVIENKEILDGNECLNLYMSVHISELSRLDDKAVFKWKCGQSLYEQKRKPNGKHIQGNEV